MAQIPVVVAAPCGALQGVAEDGAVLFRGIPYAAPPVGAARFAPPQPLPPWAGLRDATTHGPIAPQPASRLRAAMGDFSRPQAEDCLTLSLAVPAAGTAASAGQTDAGTRPVIVWLHGGAYLSGAGSLDWYDGATLARENGVVVVGVNYRLGALGFLHLPGVADGNMALLDMVAALVWVRDNIGAFGGDKARVTLMGQSAGAHAIMCLLAMPEAAGLFQRAMLQSAPPAMAPTTRETAQLRATQLLRVLRAGDTPEHALRDADAGALVAAQMQVAREIAGFADIQPPFLPVFDTLASTDAFVAAAAAGALARNIPLLIGTTRDEMAAFFATDPAMAQPDPALVAQRFAALAGRAEALADFQLRRPGGNMAEWLGDLVTAQLFADPARQLADSVAGAGGVVFFYRFDWAAPANPFGACHCIELPFVFGSFPAWQGAPMLEGGNNREMAGLSSALRAAWAGFAANATPGTAALPWAAHVARGGNPMRFAGLIGQG